MEKLLEFLAANPTFYFATVDGYKPQVRPLRFFMYYNNRLYFAIGRHKRVYSQLLRNPNICMLVFNDADEGWVRIHGVAQFDNAPKVKALAHEKDPQLKELYNETTSRDFGMVYLDYAEAQFFDKDENILETVKL